MDGLAHVANQQTQQINTHSSSAVMDVKAKTIETHHQAQQVSQQTQNNLLDEKKNIQDIDNDSKIKSQKQVEHLVDKLNNALSPLNTSIKFGVDNNDIFYVSVIEEKTNKVIRRFPAEEAQSLLPKMEEVTGILFDSKG